MGLRSGIISLLTSSDVTLTDFTLFGNRICGADYRNIAECIRNGHIQIVRSGTLPSTTADSICANVAGLAQRAGHRSKHSRRGLF